jgi:23S rRNA (adenine2503-C2)-methyltransferase
MAPATSVTVLDTELKLRSRFVSRDGSTKYRFSFEPSLYVEAAYFQVPGRERQHIACVSTQLGCAVGCVFCSTSAHSFFGNLTGAQIAHQVDTIVADRIAPDSFDEGFEVSFMGMGEPLANPDNLLEALERIGQRYPKISRVSVSTAGPASRIQTLTQAMPTRIAVHLQISLHATNSADRAVLIPNAPDSIDDLLAAGEAYHHRTGDLVCLNYIPLRGFNDSDSNADWLAQIDPECFEIKLTLLNEVENLPANLASSDLSHVRTFAARIRQNGMAVRLFRGDGLDIRASCGQLAAVPHEVSLVQLQPFSKR